MMDFARAHPVQLMILFVVLWVIAGLMVGPILAKAAATRAARSGKLPADIPPGLDRDMKRAMGQDIPPQPGDRRYSRFFGSYVELVRYHDDRHYWFLVLSGIHAGRTYRNQAPWSILPLSRD